VFGGLNKGLLSAQNFVSATNNVARDANDFFIYNKTNSTLWFDADGNGAGAAVMVFDLATNYVMTASDITII
jgi:Ca2+-binding RTX toxin-like protein